MMTKLPYMRFYVDAYLGDTVHLNAEEHGCYMLLLFAMWRRDGTIPDNDKDNARVCRMGLSKFRKIKARLSPLLMVVVAGADRNLTQKRLKKELKIAHDFYNQQCLKSARSATMRSQRKQTLSQNLGKPSGQPAGQPMGIPKALAQANYNKYISSSSLQVATRAKEGEEENRGAGFAAPDGASPAPVSVPVDQSLLNGSHGSALLDTPYMRRALAKEGSGNV